MVTRVERAKEIEQWYDTAADIVDTYKHTHGKSQTCANTQTLATTYVPKESLKSCRMELTIFKFAV